LGAPVLQPSSDDPMCEAVKRAARAGLVVVASAGNYGRSADGKTVLGSITSPANSAHAIAVGAIDTHGTADRSDDTIAPYSSRGPTAYDLRLKPDLAAPGQHIVSAEASNAYLPTTYPAHHVTGQGPNAYFQLSGTSMSAAVVSGAAALLIDDRPALRAADARLALQVTATFMPEAGLVGAGAGNMNVLAAVDLVNGGDSPAQQFGPSIQPAANSWLRGDPSVYADSIVWGVNNASIVWGIGSNSIVWGIDADSIVWGVNSNSIVWGVKPASIVWGIGTSSIVWGLNAESIVWGVDSESIVWGIDNTGA